MPDYSSEGLANDIANSEVSAEGIRAWWDRAHSRDHEYWLSGTPGEEVWQRLAIRDHLKPGSSVLNIGVGLGRCTRELVSIGCNVSVLDISPIALERVSDVASGWNSPEDLPQDRFDVALSHLVIQHMNDFDLETQFEHVVRSLRPNGVFAFQYAAGTDGVRSQQRRKHAKSGSIRRCPVDFEGLVRDSGGYIVKHLTREAHPCGTLWMVAHVMRSQVNS